MESPKPPDSARIVELLGGSSAVAELCEITPQAVSQWFGPDPDTGVPREIPNARLLYLKAVRPEVFAKLASEAKPKRPFRARQEA